MELVTLAVLIATIATLHRVATHANDSMRALLPSLDDPLTGVLLAEGFVAKNHRAVELAPRVTNILPLSFVKEVDGRTIIVEREVDARAQTIVVRTVVHTAWPDTDAVVNWTLEPDGLVVAGLLSGGISQWVHEGATVTFDGAALTMSYPFTYARPGSVRRAVDAVLACAGKLDRGPATLHDWAFEVATSDSLPYARRIATTNLLASDLAEDKKARLVEIGRTDPDVGVRLAVAAHTGEDVVEFLRLLATSVEEPARVRRDALEQLVTQTDDTRARDALLRALTCEDGRRADALSTLTELVAESDEHAARVFALIDDAALLKPARPVLWAIIVAADEPLAIQAVDRLGRVGNGNDVRDLERLNAGARLVACADLTAARIRERIGRHGLSIVQSEPEGRLSVVGE
ncbi:MAG: hypothetical protein RMA76_07030 [Deltaproteobacteria bacterium]|jgi:hypothetical protein